MCKLATATIFTILLMAFSSVGLNGGTIDITSDCQNPCTSINYSGAPGASPSGPVVPLVINGLWATLPDLGMTGQWISYAQTGVTGSGPLATQLVNFTVDYTIDPTFQTKSITLNVLADDFATMTASPDNFGPLPAWSSSTTTGGFCSSNAPGCVPSTLYTYALNASQIAMFSTDNQLTFSVLQLVDSTPFGLAFDIRLSDVAVPAIPEPGSLTLLVLGIAGSLILRRRPSLLCARPSVRPRS